MRTALCLFLRASAAASMFAGSIPAAEPQAPPSEPPASADLSRAFVTIPYSELRALWEAGRKGAPGPPPAPAPVAHLVHLAELQLELADQLSALNAVFEVEALEEKWQTISLLGGEAQLEKAEAADQAIVWQDGYQLLTRQPGRKRVTMQLTARGLSRIAPQDELRLQLASATIKRLRVSGIPAASEVRVNGQPAGAVQDGNALFALSSAAGEVRIQIVAKRTEPPPAPKPSQWQAQSQTLVRYSEGRLRFVSRVLARAEDGSGLEMELMLPASARSISVTGDDLAESVQSRREDGGRALRLRWNTPDVLDRELTLTYAMPSPLADQWALPAPAIAEQAESRHLYAIIPSEGLELQGAELRSGSAAHRLPEWMGKEVGSAPFVTAEAGAQLTLQTRWLPAIATAEAVVTKAKCQLRLVADGSLRTSATYSIRHEAPLAWRLEMPAGVELLSCTVAGRPARPIQREASALELHLPASADDSKGISSITFEYVGKTTALDPVSGQVALELPRTALFLERLDWSVLVPHRGRDSHARIA
ncbi:MAG: hypothetical protein M3463_23695, partial [Verrucomicrobiota bacterium]|nr:hypothetical protein [Verrucomicrobiota bacterium]